ncbi:MAG: hypothetical protein JXA64_09485 [Candidatus Fermentibacteraceae bacterium]|nr:hypothetical protein [Candidatus Fermentibacteraceae bacterium]MBN2609331.1 hypothetical protein [Candidatus Fermentibacteraceae bacterium]
MKRTLIPMLAAILLVAAGCGRNPLYFRMGADYYPIDQIGSQWEYSIAGGGTLIVQVIDQTERGERACYRVLTGADYTYWIANEGYLEFYEDHRVMFNGYEVPLYQAWVTWLDWPLTTGYSRTDSASTFAVSQGVTISHDWLRTSTVLGIGTSPDGRWEQCYHLVQDETTINWIRTPGFEPETTVVQRELWLAPDVGLVERQTADSTLTLVSYTQGN